MTYEGMRLSEVLTKARDYIAQPGHYLKGARHENGPRVCAIGAIERVLGHSWYGYGFEDPEASRRAPHYEDRGEPGKEILNSCAEALFPKIVQWNNYDWAFVAVNNGGEQEDIVKVFDCAIEKARQEELVEA